MNSRSIVNANENLREHFYSEWLSIYRNVIKLPTDYLTTTLLGELKEIDKEISISKYVSAELFQKLTVLANSLTKMNLDVFAKQIKFVLSPICETSTEVLATELAETHLPLRDLTSLMCSSLFFANDAFLSDTREKKYSLRWEIVEENHQNCWYDTLSKQFYEFKHLFSENEDNKQIYARLSLIPFKLDADEVPKQILLGTRVLIFTSKNRIWAITHYDESYIIELPQGEIIETIIGSGSHVLILSKSNKLYGFGTNATGQLGLGHYQEVNYPQLIPLQTQPKQIIVDSSEIVVGSGFSIILGEDNVLYGFGDNNDGQLGLGKNVRYFETPTPIALPRQEVAVKIISAAAVGEVDGKVDTYICIFVLAQSGKLYGIGNLPWHIMRLAGLAGELDGVDYSIRGRFTYSPVAIPLSLKEVPEKIFIEEPNATFIQCQGGKIYILNKGKSDVIPPPLQCLQLPEPELPKEIIIRPPNNSLLLSQSGKLYQLERLESEYTLVEVTLPNNEIAKKILVVNTTTMILCKSGAAYVLERITC